ncbi:TIGR04372 family glycosyltransferase [Desulfovibrio sp. JC022]|uniref:TIGR04372 family glycosyltransferase n=1 Tax=Desulfovibrio sp. JC022 TaxID=2593642 RepID=UPI0013D8B5C1|nr:TIGR04372 family glycosyltransferase [Desulfovibrio sp. JC022]
MLEFCRKIQFTTEDYTKLILNFFCIAESLYEILDVILVKTRTDRIGHQVGNIAEYVAKINEEGKLANTLIFGVAQDSVANSYILDWWRTYVQFSFWTKDAYKTALQYKGLHKFTLDISENNQGEDGIEYMQQTKARYMHFPWDFKFTEEEEKHAQAEMQRMGVDPHKPFVCFWGRDSAYLKHLLNKHYSYHDYRDMDIDTYIPSMKWLAAKGITSIRMGAVVEKKLSTSGTRIVDYASYHRSEFMDVYLSAKSLFCIAADTGVNLLPIFFHKIIGMVNYPIYNIPGAFLNKNRIFIFKKFKSIQNNAMISFKDCIKMKIADLDWCVDMENQSTVQFLDNTPEEILDLVKEVYDLVNNHNVREQEDSFQDIFHKLVNESIIRQLPFPPQSQICHSFCMRNPWFLK